MQCKFIAKLFFLIICIAKRQNKHFVKEFAKYILRFLLPFAFPSFDFLCEWEVLSLVLFYNGQKCALGVDGNFGKQRFLSRLGFSSLYNALECSLPTVKNIFLSFSIIKSRPEYKRHTDIEKGLPTKDSPLIFYPTECVVTFLQP